MKTYLIPLSIVSLAILLYPTDTLADDNSPEFNSNYHTAVAKARQSGKPLIVIFSASWCPPCQQMKKQVYPSKEVRPFHDDFVWAYLDADNPANRRVMTAFRVSGIPHIAFLDSEGRAVGQFSGAVPPRRFADILTRVKKGIQGSDS